MEEMIWYPKNPVGIPSTFANSLTEQERLYGLWTSSRSCWCFCTKNDIRYAFNHDRKDVNGKRVLVPEIFTVAFDDLVVHIKFLPSRVPVTIVWNKHLPHFNSTCAQQGYKSFAVLPSDLPFDCGSLTVRRKSFRPWTDKYARF